MSHQTLAKTAPMGWNSWDCFGAAVNEKELRENTKHQMEYVNSLKQNTMNSRA